MSEIDLDDPEFVTLTPREMMAIAWVINEIQAEVKKDPEKNTMISARNLEILGGAKVKLAEQLKELREK